MKKDNNTNRHVSRRSFIKTSAMTIGALAISDVIGIAAAAEQNKAKVFFTKDISDSGLLQIYAKINKGISGGTRWPKKFSFAFIGCGRAISSVKGKPEFS